MPKIALVVMVRNDAERLRRCLSSVRGAVDEMVVLDTGSEDGSAQVAHDLGAKVTAIEWPNSFAAGLNVLLDLVDADWVLRLDSDEWFDSDPASALRELTQEEEAYAFNLVRRDLLPTGGCEEISLRRLWRPAPSLRYAGAVHENIPSRLFADAWPGKQEKWCAVSFLHDGYVRDPLEKIRRNVPLLERELEDRPGDPYFEALLAKGYLDLGDPRGRDLSNAITDRLMTAGVPQQRLQAIVVAEVVHALNGPELHGSRGECLLRNAWEWFGDSPVVVNAVALAHERRGAPLEALRALLRLGEMAATGRYDRTLPVDPRLLGRDMWLRLDRAAEEAGREDIRALCARYLSEG